VIWARWVWPGTFAAMAVFLLGRSRFLFTTRLYPSADPAANSILVVQAEHFTLLHGNYSREGFFHLGPAYLYLMAAGQWLFHDTTHLVPTGWSQRRSTAACTCLTGPYFWVFAVTSQFICGPRQEASGAAYQLHRRPYRAAPGEPVIARLRYSALTGPEGARSGG
jgi:hypothetical protein